MRKVARAAKSGASTPKVHAAFAALEDRVKRLERALDINSKVFSDSIFVLEGQNEVLRRALQDVFSVLKVSQDCTYAPVLSQPLSLDYDHIDYNAYMKSFIDELVEREAKKEEDARKGRILLDSSDTDSPIIFGE